MKKLSFLLFALLFSISLRAEYTSPDGLVMLKSTEGWTALNDSAQPGEYGFINDTKTVVLRINASPMEADPEVIQQFIQSEGFQETMKEGFKGDDGIDDLRTAYVNIFQNKAFAIYANLDDDDEPMLESTGKGQYGVAYVVGVGNYVVLLGMVSTEVDPQNLPGVKAMLKGLVINGTAY